MRPSRAARLSRPAGAPLAGAVGRSVRDVRTGRFERALAGLAAAGALVTTAEIYTSHDSASFGNKMMWWPIVIVPTLLPAGVAAVFSRRAAKTVLPAASLLVMANGAQGTFFHFRGITCNPPIPAVTRRWGSTSAKGGGSPTVTASMRSPSRSGWNGPNAATPTPPARKASREQVQRPGHPGPERVGLVDP